MKKYEIEFEKIGEYNTTIFWLDKPLTHEELAAELRAWMMDEDGNVVDDISDYKMTEYEWATQLDEAGLVFDDREAYDTVWGYDVDVEEDAN